MASTSAQELGRSRDASLARFPRVSVDGVSLDDGDGDGDLKGGDGALVMSASPLCVLPLQVSCACGRRWFFPRLFVFAFAM